MVMRGFVRKMAVVTACSTATGCYPSADISGQASYDASGDVADDFAGFDVTVTDGGYQPRLAWGAVSRSWMPPVDVRRFQVVTAVPRVIASDPAMLSTSDGGYVLIQQEAPGGGGEHILQEYAVSSAGVITTGSAIATVSNSLGYVWSPVLLGGDRQRLLVAQGDRILLRWRDGESGAWSSARKIIDCAGAVRMRAAWHDDDVILLIENGDGVQHYYSRDAGETWSWVAEYTLDSFAVAYSQGRWAIVSQVDDVLSVRTIGDVSQVMSLAPLVTLATMGSVKIVAVEADGGAVYVYADEGTIRRQIDVWESTDGAVSWQRIGQADGSEVAAFSSPSTSVYGVPLAATWTRDRLAMAWTTSNGSNDDYLWLGEHGGWTVAGVSLTDASTEAGAGSVYLPGASSLEALDDPNITNSTTGTGVAASGQLAFEWHTSAGSDLAQTVITDERTGIGGMLRLRCKTTGDAVQVEMWTTESLTTAKVLVSLEGSQIVVKSSAGSTIATLTGVNTDAGGLLTVWQSANTADVDLNVRVSWDGSTVATGQGVAGLLLTSWPGPAPDSQIIIRIPTTNSAAARLDVESIAWDVGSIEPPITRGRRIGAYPVYITDGASVRIGRGLAQQEDSGDILPEYTHGATQLEADSPRQTWVGTGDTNITLTPNARGGHDGPWGALILQGASGWRTATLLRDSTEVIIVDLATGLTGLEFSRYGNAIVAGESSGVGRWLDADELVGGMAVIDGDYLPIVGNTSGRWGQDPAVVVWLGGDVSGVASSGDVVICAPRWAGAWEAEAAVSEWTLQIDDGNGSPTLGTAFLGEFRPMGWQYDAQVQIVQQVGDKLDYDDQQRALIRDGGGNARVFTLSWSDSLRTLGETGTPPADDAVARGGTLADLAGLVRSEGRGLVALLREVALSEGIWASTARDAFVVGRITSSVETSMVADDDGQEVAAGWGRSGQVVIQEEV